MTLFAKCDIGHHLSQAAKCQKLKWWKCSISTIHNRCYGVLSVCTYFHQLPSNMFNIFWVGKKKTQTSYYCVVQHVWTHISILSHRCTINCESKYSLMTKMGLGQCFILFSMCATLHFGFAKCWAVLVYQSFRLRWNKTVGCGALWSDARLMLYLSRTNNENPRCFSCSFCLQRGII